VIKQDTQVKPRTSTVRGSRVSFFDDFPDVTPKPGTILVRTRAISARVNKNFDGFESQELKKAYRTFVGRPVFVNHQNLNYRKTRGIVRGSVYKENGTDKYIDLLIEVDAKAYPRLAAEIEAGRLDGVSMGCFAPNTLITMADGSTKAIEKVEVDDEILTHRGNVEPVTYVMVRPYDGTMVTLNVSGDEIVLTSEHPVWVRSESLHADSNWVPAIDVSVGDWVFTPAQAVREETVYVPGETWPCKDGLWRRINKATTDQGYIPEVYNLDVDGDDSYVAGGIAVHNCDVGFTVCSYCGNVARDPYEFCDHVLAFKGAVLERISDNFEKQAVLVYEQCKNVSFFEISFVFDPADETALVQEVYVPGGSHFGSDEAGGGIPGPAGVVEDIMGAPGMVGDFVNGAPGAGAPSPASDPAAIMSGPSPGAGGAQPPPGAAPPSANENPLLDAFGYTVPVIPKLGFGETIAPPQVDTMRAEENCPQCGDEGFDGKECQLCRFRQPPEELQEPNLDKAKQIDLRQKPLDRQARRNLSANPFVRRS